MILKEHPALEFERSPAKHQELAVLFDAPRFGPMHIILRRAVMGFLTQPADIRRIYHMSEVIGTRVYNYFDRQKLDPTCLHLDGRSEHGVIMFPRINGRVTEGSP